MAQGISSNPRQGTERVEIPRERPALANQEREASSKRPREALAAAKLLGNPNGAAAALWRARKGNGASLAAIKARAYSHAADLRPGGSNSRAKA